MASETLSVLTDVEMLAHLSRSIYHYQMTNLRLIKRNDENRVKLEQKYKFMDKMDKTNVEYQKALVAITYDKLNIKFVEAAINCILVCIKMLEKFYNIRPILCAYSVCMRACDLINSHIESAQSILEKTDNLSNNAKVQLIAYFDKTSAQFEDVIKNMLVLSQS